MLSTERLQIVGPQFGTIFGGLVFNEVEKKYFLKNIAAILAHDGKTFGGGMGTHLRKICWAVPPPSNSGNEGL